MPNDITQDDVEVAIPNLSGWIADVRNTGWFEC